MWLAHQLHCLLCLDISLKDIASSLVKLSPTPISCFLLPTGLRGVVGFNIWARKSHNELVEEIEDDTLEVGVEVEVVGIGVDAEV